MECQLRVLPEAGQEPCRVERLLAAGRDRLLYDARRLSKIITDPGIVRRKLGEAWSRAKEHHGATPADKPSLPPLGLEPGERVRVKSLAAIEATLDEERRCEGMAFMGVMAAFCGQERVVRRRVTEFFDERTRRMLKLRNVVTLDGVYCVPARDGRLPYARCERECFLFWKEAWLERVDGA